VLDKLYQHGRTAVQYFLIDIPALHDHQRLGKDIFRKNEDRASNRNRFYYNLDRIFAYLAATKYLDSAEWNRKLEQSKNLPFVQSSTKYTPYSGEVHALPQSCLVVANDYPKALMVDLKAALEGDIYFTDDASQSGFVVTLDVGRKLANAAVKYVGGTSVDYYDVKTTVRVKNNVGEDLYSGSCTSVYGAPQTYVNPGERSKTAVPMTGDECAKVTGDIVQLFKDFYGNK